MKNRFGRSPSWRRLPTSRRWTRSAFLDKDWFTRGREDIETWATIIVNFEDGTRAVIFSSDYVQGGMEDSLEVFLSNSRVSFDMTHSTMMKSYAPDPTVFGDEYIMEKLQTKAGWSYPGVDEESTLGYPQELEAFVDDIREDREPVSDGRFGLEVTRVVYAAYQSAEEGRRIEL